jgi:hypothetical protein
MPSNTETKTDRSPDTSTKSPETTNNDKLKKLKEEARHEMKKLLDI